jgi:hypothetical protein
MLDSPPHLAPQPPLLTSRGGASGGGGEGQAEGAVGGAMWGGGGGGGGHRLGRAGGREEHRIGHARGRKGLATGRDGAARARGDGGEGEDAVGAWGGFVCGVRGWRSLEWISIRSNSSTLPCAPNPAHGKAFLPCVFVFAVCYRFGSWQTRLLYSVPLIRNTAKCLCCVFLFLPCVSRATHGKRPFVVCPILCTRQTCAHTAKYHFPVVCGRVKWPQAIGSCCYIVQLHSYVSVNTLVM